VNLAGRFKKRLQPGHLLLQFDGFAASGELDSRRHR
jgi:hypothetical protein